jgi:non-specific serine/threonine protein kinase/serine/threonine-protein kinase
MFDIHDAIASLPGSTKAREVLVRHALRYLDGLPREYQGDLGLQHEVGVAYAKIGDVLGRPEFPNLGQSAQALASYEKAIGILGGAYGAAPESAFILRDMILVTQRKADLLGAMGRRDEAVKQADGARKRIVAYLKQHPDDLLWQGDLCVAVDHLIDLRLAVADTAGALAECITNVALAEALQNPKEPESRRGLLIARAKMANLRAMRGERDSALIYYRGSEMLAREAVASLPNNTDASRDLGIVYGMHAQFLADGGETDSAVAIYKRSMKITADLARMDPDNALVWVDVAHSDYELATILAKGRRYHDAEQRYDSAYQQYSRLAAADTANVDNRLFMAKSSRGAGEACRSLSQRTGSEAERSRCRARAGMWLERSLAVYRKLQASGALAGEDAAAPAQLESMLAQLGLGSS